jgi:hypothetical protein
MTTPSPLRKLRLKTASTQCATLSLFGEYVDLSREKDIFDYFCSHEKSKKGGDCLEVKEQAEPT